MTICISREGVELGSWSEQEVRAFYQEGRLIDSDYYWTEGMSEWMPLSGIIRPPPPFPSSPETTVVSELPDSNPRMGTKVNDLIETQNKYGGLGRLGFAIASFGAITLSAIVSTVTYQSGDLGLIQIITAIVIVSLTAGRLKNIGMPMGFCFLSIVPIAGLFFFIACIFIPTGYADKNKRRNPKWLVNGGIFTTIAALLIIMVLSVYWAARSQVPASTPWQPPPAPPGDYPRRIVNP